MHLVTKSINLIKNMGLRYTVYRVQYALASKLGWHKTKFPTNPTFQKFVSLKQWKENTPIFFFKNKEDVKLSKKDNDILAHKIEGFKEGIFTFFSNKQYQLNPSNSWHTNPITNYTYNSKLHWSKIKDFSTTAGDIKYVWEKARFSFLYDVIRNDYHNNKDESEFVFSEIEDFIHKNPINLGPHYKCSQEISLRILNWTFALYYFKDSSSLTENRFQSIINSIFWQLHHVYNNINFSRIAVRNNHAITETLTLYLSGLLFPFIPETRKWSIKGKKWFEEEIDYQIYNDGTFLQFSMNYHRVVVQLLTWALRLSQLHNDSFTPSVYEKAKKSLAFLEASQDPVSMQLPNYGSNDGALFFKLTDDDYRNYQSQLDDLSAVLYNSVRQHSESQAWYGLKDLSLVSNRVEGVFSFNDGGYYIFQEKDVKTFIKCGAYKDRPAQADNLHLDIWHQGINYLWDTGSYRYNTDSKTLNYFVGTPGHNTVAVNAENQMLKGKRFIWYNWIKEAEGAITEETDRYIFQGSIKAFKHIGLRQHTRTVTKFKNKLKWIVEDKVFPLKNDTLIQYWHINPNFEHKITITATTATGVLEPKREKRWYSGYYGEKKPSIRKSFRTKASTITTIITIET